MFNSFIPPPPPFPFTLHNGKKVYSMGPRKVIDEETYRQTHALPEFANQCTSIQLFMFTKSNTSILTRKHCPCLDLY